MLLYVVNVAFTCISLSCPYAGKQDRVLKGVRACGVCRGALLLQLLDAYAVRYSEMLEGRSEALPVSELAGGARIRHIFQEIFHQGLSDLNPSQ